MAGIMAAADFLGLTDEWGIFQGGSSVIEFDSFLAVEVRDSSRIATYPLEDGAFASFNKVENPFEIRVTITRGGSPANRTAFLDSILGLKKSFDLYEIVTPEKTYLNVNLENFSFRRSSRSGKTLITAELFFKEIRLMAASSNYSTSSASGAAAAIGGMVSSVATTAASVAGGVTTALSAIGSTIPGIPVVPGVPGLADMVI
jgi:hypothetical protein